MPLKPSAERKTLSPCASKRWQEGESLFLSRGVFFLFCGVLFCPLRRFYFLLYGFLFCPLWIFILSIAAFYFIPVFHRVLEEWPFTRQKVTLRMVKGHPPQGKRSPSAKHLHTSAAYTLTAPAIKPHGKTFHISWQNHTSDKTMSLISYGKAA